MIRFINCVRRHPDVTEVEFRQYWDSDEFADLVGRMARAVGADHYQFKRTLLVEANQNIRQLRGGAEPFDGIVEYWFASGITAMSDLLENPSTRQIMAEMNDYQARFLDLPRCSGFFTEG